MLRFIDHTFGTIIIGPIFGLIYSLGILFLLGLNILIAAAFLVNDIIIMLIKNSSSLLTDLFNSLRHPLPGFLLFTVITVPTIISRMIIELGRSIITALWNIAKTIATCLLLAIAQPFIGLMNGLLYGSKKAILDPITAEAPPPEKNQWLRFKPQYYFRQLQLPLNQALSFPNKNKHLSDQINMLETTSNWATDFKLNNKTIAHAQQLKNEDSAIFLAYQKITNYRCVLTKQPLLNIKQPLTVEYQDANDNQHWHIHVYERKDFLAHVRDATTYAVVPQTGESLTTFDLDWSSLPNNDDILERSDQTMKIYAGIPDSWRQELTSLMKALRRLYPSYITQSQLYHRSPSPSQSPIIALSPPPSVPLHEDGSRHTR